MLSTFSEDEQYKAILRKVTVDNTSKQFIEIWDRQHLLKNYDLSVYDVHGDIYTDGNFYIEFNYPFNNIGRFYSNQFYSLI